MEPCGTACFERACSAIAVLEKLNVSDLVPLETRLEFPCEGRFFCLRYVTTMFVYTYIRPNKTLLLPRARLRQQLCESLEPAFSHVPQLLEVDLLDWFVQTIHKFEALGGDPCQHQSPVSAFARARNQAAFFHTVEKPRDIGITGNHAAGNLPAREPLRRPSQDTQNIVLS